MPATLLPALRLDCAAETVRIVEFIRQKVTSAGFQRAVLGLSGGIDSALVAALSAAALGPDNVRAVLLPYRTSDPASEADARLVAAALGIDVAKFDISGMVDAIVSQQPEMSGGRKGNIMARARMICLYDQSVVHNALVVGTSNRTETLLGYFTLHGDGAAALKPIAHLYKCQVRALSAHLGLPEPVIAKAPSADLWAGQTDEGELGFTYDEADQVLYLLTEEHLAPKQIASLGFDLDTVRAIADRMRRYAFKLEPAACLTD
jgi:NAD+ synthase